MEVLLGPNNVVGGSSLMDQHRNNDSDSSSLNNEDDDDDSSSDSSIGAPDDSEEEEEEVIVEEEEEEEDEDGGFNNGSGGDSSISREGATALKKGGFGSLGSLASLEDSLPIKRGLSIHMSGKSKSFTNLSEAANSMESVKDLEKTEHPFNKKRRVLRWSRRNYYKLGGNNPKSMPVLPLIQDDEEEDDDEAQSCSSTSRDQAPSPTKHRSVFKSSSYSCFSLADLPEQEEEEEEDDD